MDVAIEILSAILLFGLVVFLAWLTTRLVGQQWGAGPRRGRALSVREQVPIGKERSISLVEVGDRLYVVGATPQGITLLDLITDPAVIAQVRAATPPNAPIQMGGLLTSFPALLQKGLGGAPTQPNPMQPEVGGFDPLQRLQGWQKDKK